MKPPAPEIPIATLRTVEPIPGGGVVLRIAYHIQAETNRREHWRAAMSRKQKLKDVFRRLYLAGRIHMPALPLSVEFVRIGKRWLDDDNLPGAFKYQRDALCDVLGVSDGRNSPIKFSYRQEIGKAYIAEIWIRPTGVVEKV